MGLVLSSPFCFQHGHECVENVSWRRAQFTASCQRVLPEFKSTYLETLVARYQSTKETRPRAKSRFGSVIEKMFGVTNTQFIHNLRGNTQITRNVRHVTKSVDPEAFAT